MVNPQEKTSSKFSMVFKSYEQFLKRILNMLFTRWYVIQKRLL